MVITINSGMQLDTAEVIKIEWKRYCKQYKGYLYRLDIQTKYHREFTLWFNSYWKSKYYYWLIKLLK